MPFSNFNPNPKNPKPQNPFLPKMAFPNFSPNLQNPFSNIQTHLSSFLHHLSCSPLPNPTLSFQTHFKTTLQNLQTQAKQALSSFAPPPNPIPSSAKSPVWARAYSQNQVPARPHTMPAEAIEERLAGIPVYALSNAEEEFVLVSGVRSRKSLGLFCFKREDAEALLEQMKAMDPTMRQGSKVVAVALNKVFQLKVDGVAFRFIPDSYQIMNALKEKEKVGESAEGFSGVPVFQSRSLILASQNKRYRPVFFRQEDLEKSLLRASQQQKNLNPAFSKGDIQVCVLEEIIKGMKESSSSEWDDVVFIPPGFDVSAGVSQ
ncbi:protein TIC 22-like, chloroplastic isoform X2 [Magnolia sinica]|uniref:protein TIC 22-like, chloroplastic isoform X2 n=1 Tax=Magnolia sinica TaxID=86752 RepID=UPI002659EA62|nr:protein TIC 22-like, chloroplastic isoform X2 [Magnolia sinica]